MSVLVAELKNAYKSFDKHMVLSDINIQLNKGMVLGLIGPSGSGKTTAIKCLLGMEALNEGTATIFGNRMPNRKVLNHIGYMGQSDALYEGLTARENLTFFGKLAQLSGKQLKSAMTESMKLVSLEDKMDQVVSTFSGGMKRRLSLATTLLTNPDLIILDEPTVGIDPSLRNQVWKQLNSLSKEGKSIITTTHVMDEAERCDYIGLIVMGEVFALGTPQELKDEFNADSIEEVFLKAEEGKQG